MMSAIIRNRRLTLLLGSVTAAVIAVGQAGVPAAAGTGHPGPSRMSRGVSGSVSAGVTRMTEVSRGCSGQNAEVEEATGAPRYVYELWIGCGGIGFARSTDGGLHFGKAVTMPDSSGSWDPAIAVAPDGTVYAAYMHAANGYMYPVVAASFDHGASFPQVSSDLPPVKGNWGDRDFIAVARNGDVYVTYDYGPSAANVKLLCSSSGSCAYGYGQLNAVIQKSTDGGRTWGPVTPIEPTYPDGGGYSAPLVTQPDGTIDVLYISHPTDPGTLKLHPGYEYFTSSRNSSAWPSSPLRMWPGKGTLSLPEWWVDGDIGTDVAGNLYATWDTQTARGDIGYLTSSRDGGRTWSQPVRVTPDTDNAMHNVEVVGGRPGIAYVAWQTDASPRGYATYLRPYSIVRGWLGPAIRVSSRFGSKKIWPGDTFGIAVLHGGPGTRIALSWGSAVGGSKDSQIYESVVTLPSRP